jgi:hypothetical protein
MAAASRVAAGATALVCLALCISVTCAESSRRELSEDKPGADFGLCSVNLCIAVDQGGTTTAEDYEKEKESVVQLVDGLRNKTGSQYLSLVQYSDRASPVTGGSSLEEALAATRKLAESGESATSGTNIGDAILTCAQNMHTIPVDDREQLPKVILLLTDDDSSMPISKNVATAYSVLASYAAVAQNISIVTAAVGDNVNTTLLQLFSSKGPGGAPLTFQLDDWEFAQWWTVRTSLLRSICKKGDAHAEHYQHQLQKPADLTTLMTEVLNSYSDAQDKTNVIVSFPQVIDNMKNVIYKASNESELQDVSYLSMIYKSDHKPDSTLLAPPVPAANSSSSSNSTLPQTNSTTPSSSAPSGPARKCASKPMCRMYLENMACCEEQGVLAASGSSAQLFVMCSETLIALPPKCLQVQGPDNTEVRFKNGQELEGTPGQMLFFSANWDDDDYTGKVVVDANATREEDGNCQLQLVDPCEYGGVLYKTVPSIAPVTFSVVDGGAKEIASLLPDDADMDVLTDSIVWTDVDSDKQCQQEVQNKLPDEFYANAWMDFSDGFGLKCNDFESSISTAGRR